MMKHDADDALRFALLTSDLLMRAGGGLSADQGAVLLKGSVLPSGRSLSAGDAIRVWYGADLIYPRCQFGGDGADAKLLPGIPHIVEAFRKAGTWSALQFLLEPDPNVGGVPLDALKSGRLADVIHAARGYLGLVEQ